MFDFFQVQYAQRALIDRCAGTEREERQCNDETPEVQLAPMAERMRLVRRAACAMITIEQQEFVGRIDDRMHGFTLHRGASGPECRAGLCGRDEDIADESGVDGCLRDGPGTDLQIPRGAARTGIRPPEH